MYFGDVYVNFWGLLASTGAAAIGVLSLRSAVREDRRFERFRSLVFGLALVAVAIGGFIVSFRPTPTS